MYPAYNTCAPFDRSQHPDRLSPSELDLSPPIDLSPDPADISPPLDPSLDPSHISPHLYLQQLDSSQATAYSYHNHSPLTQTPAP
jgi:hypothetical protein